MNPWLRRLILVVSIGGGFVGLTLTAAQMTQGDMPLVTLIFDGFMILAYSAGVYGGIKLVEEERIGVIVLSWYFLAQVPIVTSPLFSYRFSSGCTLSAALGNNGFTWGFFLGSRWQIMILRLNEPLIALGANFFAIWATWYLRRRLAAVQASAAPATTPSETSIPPPNAGVGPS